MRYKKDIVPLSNALINVTKLKGVNYYWKAAEFPEKQFSEKQQIGFIAQELEKIYPEMVITDKDGYKSVDYSRLTPVLVEAIKELNAKNETQLKVNKEQQNQINDLQRGNKTAELKIQKLEATVDFLIKSGIKEEKK
jgi:hypothetical protein